MANLNDSAERARMRADLLAGVQNLIYGDIGTGDNVGADVDGDERTVHGQSHVDRGAIDDSDAPGVIQLRLMAPPERAVSKQHVNEHQAIQSLSSKESNTAEAAGISAVQGGLEMKLPKLPMDVNTAAAVEGNTPAVMGSFISETSDGRCFKGTQCPFGGNQKLA